MTRFAFISLSLMLWMLLTLPVQAAMRPVAIVEEVSYAKPPISALDYVRQGQVIDLNPAGRMTLDYLSSCIRERIKGGRVTTGEAQSAVAGGEVKRVRVECDGGALELSPAMAEQSAIIVFRGYDASASKTLPKPQVTLYCTSPVVKLALAGGMLQIRRIDRPEQLVELRMDHAAVDLAPQGISLTPGGLYQASAQGKGITFKIDLGANCGPGPGPVVSRLLVF